MRFHLRKILTYLLLGIFGSAISITAGYFIAEVFFTVVYPQPVPVKTESVAEPIKVPEEKKIISNPKVLDINIPEVLSKGDVIVITFDSEMNPDVTAIDTDIKGRGNWVSGKEFEYTVTSVIPNKQYSIGVKKDSQSLDGGVLESDVYKKVWSANKLTYKINVNTNEQGIRNPITVSFNQPVDKNSAESAFNIKPAVKGTFSWKGQTLTFYPSSFQYQTQYTVSLSGNVKTERGPSVNISTSVSFQTEAEVFKLKVPYFHQQYLNSCEAAALRMALAYYNVHTDDMSIVKKFGYNPRYKATSTNSWDDPREMFVGYVDQQGSNSGYGVYGPPVEKAAKAFGRDAQFQNVVTPRYIAEEIKAGRPVIFWGFTSTTQSPYTWNVPRGGTITAFKGEHARLIVGLKGSVSNPVGFYVHDPINGNQYQYWDSNKLMRQALYLPGVTDQIVVVK
jgi:uncharacterized protein YvpB